MEDVLEELSDAGEATVLVVSVGFVSDHLEILYDVTRERASKFGMHFERAEFLNTDPLFVEAMAGAVRDASVRPSGG